MFCLKNLGSHKKNWKKTHGLLFFVVVASSTLIFSKKTLCSRTLNVRCSFSVVHFQLDSQVHKILLWIEKLSWDFRYTEGSIIACSVYLRMTGNLSDTSFLSFHCYCLAASVHFLLCRWFFWQTCSDNRALQSKHQWGTLTEHVLLWKHLHLPYGKGILG